MNLRPYQEEAIASIASELQHGRNRLLLQMGTGSGKTLTAASLLRHPTLASWMAHLPASPPRVLFFVHREEIVQQAAQTFRAVNPRLMVSIEQGNSHANRFADVVVASIQTLAAVKHRRLRELVRFRPFNVVFCDEAHRAVGATYRTALVHLGFLPPEDASDDENADVDVAQLQANLAAWDARAPKDRLLIGLTATPNRSDGVGLSAVFQSIAFSYPLRRGIDDGYLVPPVPWVVDTSTNLDGVRVNRGDFNQGDLQKAVNVEDRNRLTVAGWLKFAAGRPTIAFTAGVEHAHDLAAAFASEGVISRPVSGETPKDERRQILDDYKTGRVTVLTNDSVFTEGTDLPLTSCVLMAKPTKSPLLYEQCIGRGLRLHGDKRDCILIDVVDVARKHSLMTAPSLYGLPPKLTSDSGKNLNELAAAWEAFAEKHPGINVETMGRVSIEQIQVKASTFSMWEVPALGAFAAGRTMAWVKVSADSFRLQFPWQDGIEILTVVPDLLGQFAVSCTFRPAVGNVRQRTLVSGVESAAKAAEIAELYVKNDRAEVTKLMSIGARWRKDPASERQVAWLRWKGIPHRADISKGEAADLRNQYEARTGR